MLSTTAMSDPNHRKAQERDELESQKIAARRARDVERMQRFKAMRTAGVNQAQHLDEQRRRMEEKAADQRYADQLREVSVEVERQRAKETERKKVQLKQLKEEWDRSLQMYPKNNAPKIGDPIHPEKCGMAAVQKIDVALVDKARQARQMRTWQIEAMTLKKAQIQKSQEEDHRFAEWEKQVLDERSKFEEREQQEKFAARKGLRDEYISQQAAKLMVQQQEKRQNDAANDAEIQRNLTDPMLCEDYSQNDDGRVRIDHFRGFTKNQTKAIYDDNERLKASKHDLQQQVAAYDAAFHKHLTELESAVVAAEHDRSETKKAHLAAVKLDHEKQRLLEHQRKIRSKKDAFGNIADSGGLMYGFGTSYR